MDRAGDPSVGREFLKGFTPLLGITEFLGAVVVILVIVWTSYYRNGFAWRSAPQLEFNWHPLLMIIGLVYLYGNGKHF